MKKICIEMHDDGQIMVGMEPEMPMESGAEGGMADMKEDNSYMQPAKSVDEALSMAKQMMMGGEEQGAMTPEKMLEQPMAAGEMMQAGFKKARGPQAGF